MNISRKAPSNFQEWTQIFELLSRRSFSEEEMRSFERGSCLGMEGMMSDFWKRLLETVNQVINRGSRRCSRQINEALEEGDFSNIEVILRRGKKEIGQCRFYQRISFLPKEAKAELDEKTMAEMKRYWQSLQRYFQELAEESGSQEMLDLVYYIRRMRQ